MSNDDFSFKARKHLLIPGRCCSANPDLSFKKQWVCSVWMLQTVTLSVISTRVKSKCYSFVLSILRLQSERKEGKNGSLLSTQGKILALVFQNTPGSSIRPSILAHCQEAHATNQNTLFLRGHNKTLWTMSPTAQLMPSWWQTDFTFLFILHQSAVVTSLW